MKKITGMNKKYKWMLLLASLFLVLAGMFAYARKDKTYAADPYYQIKDSEGNVVDDSYTMRRSNDTFTIATDDVTVTNYEWSIVNNTVLQIISNGTPSTSSTGQNVNINVVKPGNAMLTVLLKDSSGNIVKNMQVQISVAFSINEYIDPNSGAEMVRIFDEDARKSLVMLYGNSVEFGTSALKEPGKLNLNYGSAADNTMTTWTSSNKDVIDINTTTKTVSATGAGHATLTVSYTESDHEYHDTIDVYVRPQIQLEDGTTINHSEYGGYTKIVEMRNNDLLKVSVNFGTNPLEAISDKIVWVITKGEDENEVLVRDSKGNYTEECKDEAKLIWQPGSKSYKLNAKAGTYHVSFYVAGTYNSYDEAKKRVPGCKPVICGGGVYVRSEFTDKTVSVNIGGVYSLSEAFNITIASLQKYFDVRIDPGAGTGTATGGAIDSNNLVKYDSTKELLEAIGLGTATIYVTARDSIDNAEFKDIQKGQQVKITLTVADAFSLNISKLQMHEGEEKQLYGILASGINTTESQYKWSCSDESYVSIEPAGQYAVIKALKKTPTGSTVKVTLEWTSDEGVTLSAICEITVSESSENFNIIPSTLVMEVGQTQTIKTDIDGSADIVWLISDKEVATIVDSSAATPSAQVTALKPGEVIITALNTSNNAYATCLLTVEQPVTELQIGIDNVAYEIYETVLSKGFVFMQPLYSPEDATDTNFTWAVARGEDVAEIDNTGKVTLLKEGIAMITVKCRTITAYCNLVVKKNPITDIVPDITEIDMVKGDTYKVTTEILPLEPSDKTLIWTSMDSGVASVNNGTITAVGAGDTYITVEAAVADDDGNKASAMIKVHVREKLENVAFESNDTYINVGASKNVGLIYTPAEGINKNVEFSSSNTSIFTVEKDKDNNCTIKGVAVGTAILSCVAEDLGPGKVITCTVHVTATAVPATDFAVTPADATVDIGKTLQLEKIFTPKEATNQYVTWSSSDTAIATVNNVGTVTGVKEGKITISAVYTDTPDRVPWIRTSTITVKDAPVRATSFDVDPATKNIIVGEKFNITPIFTPDNTTNKHVDYQSLDTGVVTVDDKGVVTGVGAGDAVIQCQSEDGGFIATCAVRVDNAIEFSLSPATKEIAVGKSFKLKKVTKPADANKTATWSTSNASIASVSASGRVTGKRIGSCVISCTITKYNQSARCRVKVAKLNSKVKFDNKNIRIGVGQTHRLKTTVWTNNSSKPKLNWKSANSSVASVNSGGKITGKRVGLTKITATTNDSVRAKATCKVRVIQRISSLSLNTDYAVVYVGRTKKLTAKIKPANTTIKKVKWASGDDNIARVTGSGKIRGIAEGNTYITATATDGSNKKARCYVKVLDAVPATSIVVAQTDLTMERGDSAKLTYKVLPNDTSDNIEFASDNKRVATVNNKGNVRAVGTGNATITILASSGVSSTVDVNVVALNKTSLNMRQYDTETLTVIGTSDPITWYTANARIATVENGKVTGRAEGITYIYAYVNGCRLSCRVTITSVSD